MNKDVREAIENFTNTVNYRNNAHKQRLETMKGKSQIAMYSTKDSTSFPSFKKRIVGVPSILLSGVIF